MKLFRVEVPKSKLLLMPEAERIFFVVFGALLNDLSMFQKLMIFSTNVTATTDAVRAAQNSQALCLAKFQLGTLSEGWQLLRKNYFGSRISEKYDPLLSTPAKESLENIKRYFSRKDNWMCSVRNRFSFHYPSSEEVAQLIDEVPTSEVFEILMSEFYGNCLFSMSNVVVNSGILKSTGSHDIKGAMDEWFRDANKVAGWFGDFLGDCLLIIAREYLEFAHSEVEIPEPSDIHEIVLPYFIRGQGK